ncbi:ABC transporter ATP-binding protein [Aequorivita viscosa]|uniref:Lipopolysaccharide transport system ATP-binding protein n=1 Tax=Aequorivita viscosa TaxID=797419 RepID=A0A1M6GJR2_9FLAO|nr:ABC transporter ATP-binding protein [Aequorivita viscosa]SDW83733.1 lipopolysaccharide transport system ATP-binding protein [Aequorivita viscosa]SHJ10183.1 lipopolysaccharide transport system ATP-binding protein [Aequorivita viscosa]
MTILKAENISKQYRLGVIGTGTLSHDLNRLWYKVRGKEDPYLKIGEVNNRSSKEKAEYVWALNDINFEVKQGEVLGIIGKNGAGKSTLLKILSRVTLPTTGVIKTKGRIASLLEVGTGFHPELTGRENVFLNGAILGMTKAEIAAKLDEIVEFSGCELYIDTPVKRYSSGMKVRLAFAVAAHLEPDILVVDEVLAVGDAEFQKKAIGKMQDISKEGGRTVLFVSHNMASVKSLCTRGIVLENGTTVFEGTADESVEFYLSRGKDQNKLALRQRTDRFGNGKLKLVQVSFFNQNNIEVDQVISGEFLKIRFTFEKYDNQIDYNRFFLGVTFKDDQETSSLSYLSDEMGSDFSNLSSRNFIDLVIPNIYLRGGVYNLRIQTGIGTRREDHFDTIEEAATLHILPGNLWLNGKLNRPGNYAILPGKYIV